MYAVMWSEHCSYKSSRRHLRRLPTEAPWVLVGPGENAGVVDVGDGIAAAIRIESHNHPSAIEPYQGAATGVGGILRDIFTMGARPIALMDPLRFGPLDDARSRWIAEGVVSGISHYGNAVGVPTVGGEVVFDRDLRGQPARERAVPRACCPADRLVLGQAHGEGNLAVLLGSTTGRDGIGGVSVLASAGFGDGDEAKRPERPGGRPVRGEAADRGVPGAARRRPGRRHPGPGRGRADLRHQRDGVARRHGHGRRRGGRAPPATGHGAVRGDDEREPGAHARHRRRPRHLDEVAAALRALGGAGDGRRAGDRRAGACASSTASTATVLADVPASSLHDAAPLYDRPLRPRRPRRHEADPVVRRAAATPGADLLAMLVDTGWVWHQYDHQLFLNTVEGPGGDATVLRLKDPRTGARHRPGPGPHHRRQPPVVRRRPPRRHRPRRRRGGAEPGLRRCPAARGRELPELRQPRAPRGDVGALRGHRRHGRGVHRLRGPGGRRQREPLQRDPRAATSTRRRSSACWAWSTGSSGGLPASGSSREGCCCSSVSTPTRCEGSSGRDGRGSTGPGGASRRRSTS